MIKERRHETRIKPSPLAAALKEDISFSESRNPVSEGGVVELSLPFPKGVKMVKSLIDISPGGLSFKMAREEGFLFPGTLIYDPVIYIDGKKIEKTCAEIIHATASEEESSFKIGMRFIASARQRSVLSRKTVAYPFRPMRYDLNNNVLPEKTVHWTDRQGLSYVALLKNISFYGLAFEIPRETKEMDLRLQDTIDSLEVRVGNHCVYRGKVSIIWLRPDPSKITVGVSLAKRCDKLKELLLQEAQSFQKGKGDETMPLSCYRSLARLDTSFKAMVADLRYVLEMTEKRLKKEEKTTSRLEMFSKDPIEEVVFKQVEPDFFGYVDLAMSRLNDLVFPFDAATHRTHRDYFHKQLWNLISQSPFAYRCYTKPLGYAGDYAMMNMIYGDPYKGDTFFAKLWNKYFCSYNLAAQAYRNRIAFLIHHMEAVVQNGIKEGRKSRILSMACGPANELVEFMNQCDMSSQAELTLVDKEPEALYFAHEMLLEAKTGKGRQTNLHVYAISLMQLLMSPSLHFSSLHQQDFIYCTGLFDYLSPRLCRRALQRFFELLNDGGLLVIGNYDPCNPFKAGMEYCLEWHLRYRTQAELIQLASDAVGAASRIYCEAEKTGINNFLIIKK